MWTPAAHSSANFSLGVHYGMCISFPAVPDYVSELPATATSLNIIITVPVNANGVGSAKDARKVLRDVLESGKAYEELIKQAMPGDDESIAELETNLFLVPSRNHKPLLSFKPDHIDMAEPTTRVPSGRYVTIVAAKEVFNEDTHGYKLGVELRGAIKNTIKHLGARAAYFPVEPSTSTLTLPHVAKLLTGGTSENLSALYLVVVIPPNHLNEPFASLNASPFPQPVVIDGEMLKAIAAAGVHFPIPSILSRLERPKSEG